MGTDASLRADVVDKCANMAFVISQVALTFWAVKKSLADRNTPKIVMRIFLFIIMAIGVYCMMHGASHDDAYWLKWGIGLVSLVLVIEVWDTAMLKHQRGPSALSGLQRGGPPEAHDGLVLVTLPSAPPAGTNAAQAAQRSAPPPHNPQHQTSGGDGREGRDGNAQRRLAVLDQLLDEI